MRIKKVIDAPEQHMSSLLIMRSNTLIFSCLYTLITTIKDTLKNEVLYEELETVSGKKAHKPKLARNRVDHLPQYII